MLVDLVKVVHATKHVNKGVIVMNWINGFDAGNKKEKYSLTCRLGTFTLLEIKVEKGKFRFMICNLGFEL